MKVLSVDIGGTKTLLTLVDGPNVMDRIVAPTKRDAQPQDWVNQIAILAKRWAGQFDRAGITVTGLIKDNCWQTLNSETLSIPGRFALHRAAETALGVPVALCNDAQAAAWGEYLHGAGQGLNIVFLTISTGVGGGVVSNGKILHGRSGLAGHFGQTYPLPDGDENRFEDSASGRWMASEARRQGYEFDARSVFEAARQGHQWAEEIVDVSAHRVGRLCCNLQLIFDPDITVIGGGVGLAPGYIERLKKSVDHLQPLMRPTFRKAALGNDAGVIGVADLSRQLKFNKEEVK
ncbi:ROK family protein [Ahrensia sp. 13_GOM-1096m]|uniref:ROK family protein n=1 Tax=Ahrensia sp. 13_GOM-1096m TaxID=1380380 RepID=UPI0004791A41|nr:ROK family protein [Ahrensia sp. 13_GOM-1096m]